jgi:hypothetical protein
VLKPKKGNYMSTNNKKSNKKAKRNTYHPGIGHSIEGHIRSGWGNAAIIRKYTPDYIKTGRDEATAIATLRVLISKARAKVSEVF